MGHIIDTITIRVIAPGPEDSDTGKHDEEARKLRSLIENKAIEIALTTNLDIEMGE